MKSLKKDREAIVDAMHQVARGPVRMVAGYKVTDFECGFCNADKIPVDDAGRCPDCGEVLWVKREGRAS